MFYAILFKKQFIMVEFTGLYMSVTFGLDGAVYYQMRRVLICFRR